MEKLFISHENVLFAEREPHNIIIKPATYVIIKEE